MILFFYNLALFAGLLLSAPWWLWKMATTHKYREGMLERLGRVPKGLSGRGTTQGDPPAAADRKAIERPLLWLHAVSVGEVLAVSRLVAELDAAVPEYTVVLSTSTRTGQTLARERFGRERVFYCPLDLPWAVNAYLNALQPSMLILAETEFWPNLLSGCFRRQIPVAVVNARISDRSWPRYRFLRGLWRPFLSRLSAVLAQSKIDAQRLRALGCGLEAVSVAGNLKFDVRAAKEAEATRQLKQLGPDLRFVVAGSTLEGEETALLAAWPELLADDPKLALVLAPRHPERFAAVIDVLNKSNRPWIKRSEWRSQPEASLEPLQPGAIVLLDTIGELASVYSLASVAFVGGSLIPAGGHNPLEPAQFGVPIVLGPHYNNFRGIVADLLAAQAMEIATPGNLAATLTVLLADRQRAKAMGARAQDVFRAQSGATARSVAALCALLFKGTNNI